MSIRAMASWRTSLVAFTLVLLPGLPGQNQVNEPVLKLVGISSALVDAPTMGATGSGDQGNDALSNDYLPSVNPTPGSIRKWLKVEFQYAVNPQYSSYLDEAEFKVWIEGRDLTDPSGRPNEGVAVALTGTVSYVNIPRSKGAYGVFYVHPDVLGRYSLKSATDFLKAFDVHISAMVGGQILGELNRNKTEPDPTWYQKVKAISGMVHTQDTTPFILSDKDRYPDIKQRNSFQ